MEEWNRLWQQRLAEAAKVSEEKLRQKAEVEKQQKEVEEDEEEEEDSEDEAGPSNKKRKV